MSQETVKMQTLLNEVGKTAVILGVDKLTQHLVNIQKAEINLDEKKVDLATQIIEGTCQVFEITKRHFFSDARKMHRRIANGTVAYILVKYFGFESVDVSFILKKSETMISVVRKEIANLDPSHPYDKKILSKIEEVEKKIKPLLNEPRNL